MLLGTALTPSAALGGALLLLGAALLLLGAALALAGLRWPSLAFAGFSALH